MSADQSPGADTLTVSPEETSTNFYWVVGREQRFNLQTTIRGNPSPVQIAAHIKAALSAMKVALDLGGEAKQVGGSSPAAGPASGGEWEWGKGDKGKTVLILRGEQPEPAEVPCPIHQGKAMKRRTNAEGSWLSHKDGDSYCSASFKRA